MLRCVTEPTFSEDIATRVDELFSLLKSQQQLLDGFEASSDELSADECYSAIEDISAEIAALSDGLVYHFVRRFLGASRVHEDDLRQAGRLGLVEAMDSFDPAKGRWSSWAGRQILREVHLEVQKLDHPFLTERQFRTRQEVLRALRDLQKDSGSLPSYEDVAARAGVSLASAQAIINTDLPNLSLDDPDVWDELDALVGATQSRTSADQDPYLDERLIAAFGELTADMPIDEVFVLIHRLGIVDSLSVVSKGITTLDEIGDQLGKSREWVRRKENAARKRLADKGVELPKL